MNTTLKSAPVATGTFRPGSGIWTVAEALEMLANDQAMPLTITSNTRRGPVTEFYWLRITTLSNGTRMARFWVEDCEGRCYDLPVDQGRGCQCPHHEKRGAVCKHRRVVEVMCERGWIF